MLRFTAYASFMIEVNSYTIRRSNRRSIALQITEQAELVIRAPFGVSERKILGFVNQKVNWILTKQQMMRNRLATRRQLRFVEGEEIFFLGKKYPLRIFSGADIELIDALEFPKRFLRSPKKHLANWYRNQAHEYIDNLCRQYASQMGLRYASLRMSSATKRLGSCSQSNELSFSWHLIKTPKEVVAYVVIHELCHVAIKNHSKDFWAMVEVFFPDHKAQRKWIKEHFGALLY